MAKRRIAAMDDEEIIAAIREAIEVANYETDNAKNSKHMGEEGFTIFDAERTVLHGEVIEIDHGRWLFCGRAYTLKQDARFHSDWLHVSVDYDVDNGVDLVTMYRPSLAEWRTERVRR
jgi:hypothetical protein